MGLATKRKICPRGNRKASNSVVIPSKLKTGEIATIAANRLMIIDPRGEIHENDLLDFLEKYVEPNFWPWYHAKTEAEK